MSKKIITVFGTSRAKAGDEVYQLAYEIGAGLAQAGYIIANGGYGGTMLAAAKGAAEKAGQTIGVTCSAFDGKPNKYITKEIVTSSIQERLRTLIKLGRGYIVLPGGTGTLLELAMVWELKNKGFINKPKPIILVTDFWKPVIEAMAADDRRSRECVKLADGPNDVIKILAESNLKI